MLLFPNISDRALDEKTIKMIEVIQTRGVGELEYFELIDGSDNLKISASSASLGEPHKLKDIAAKLVSEQGRELTLTSDEATVDRGSNIASFNQNVIVTTAEDIKLYTDQLYVSAFDRSVESPGKIIIKGASWDLTAASMQTHRDEQKGKEFVLFTGNVKLIYFSLKEN
jgi:lipopolysaccharide export system protein LptC